MPTIQIAAVGDILMWESQIKAARNSGDQKYAFGPMFKEVAPIFKAADLTIGNLETTLSGSRYPFLRRSSKTGYPMFNCPDPLAVALKKSGIDVLTTANNHCMDCGITGLQRTLKVLDQAGIRHTGTFASRTEAAKDLIIDVKGIKIGIVAYTYGTNFIPVPREQLWSVNRINLPKMTSDMKRIRKKSDIVIASVHFGQEFHRNPNDQQKQLVKQLFASGADIVLGCHPHVLQPMYFYKMQHTGKGNGNRFVIYSMGNFISDIMLKSPHSLRALILQFSIHKDDEGNVRLNKVRYTPTWVHKANVGGRTQFRVLPVKKFISKPDALITEADRKQLHLTWTDTRKHMGGNIEIN